MDKKPSVVLFIDRINFTQLQDRKFSLEDIYKLYNPNYLNTEQEPQAKTKVSNLTLSQIFTINDLLQNALFNYDSYYGSYVFMNLLQNARFNYDSFHGSYVFMNKEDQNYVDHYAKTYLKDELSSSIYPISLGNNESSSVEPKKYYEIIPTPDSVSSNLIVVVEEGFFLNVTKSKDELLQFILDCLSYQYKLSSGMEPLLKMYLSIKINDGQFDLIKVRFDSPSR